MSSVIELERTSSVQPISLKEKKKVTQQQAEEAVRTLISWMGDDPSRAGLIETPKRFVQACEEWFEGYKMDPSDILSKQFDEIDGYQAPIILKDIPFHSHCEHHIAPIIGKITISYIPHKKVVGISKLARLAKIFALRLQIQERLTAQIGNTLHQSLETKGVAVKIEGHHHCMTTRGVHLHDTNMVTFHFTGCYQNDPALRAEFLNL